MNNSLFRKYIDRLTTYNKVSLIYYQSKIIDSIARYIKSYYIYKRSKFYKEEKLNHLKLLSILN